MSRSSSRILAYWGREDRGFLGWRRLDVTERSPTNLRGPCDSVGIEPGGAVIFRIARHKDVTCRQAGGFSRFGAFGALLKRPHELRRARHVSGVNPSSGTALKTESPFEGAEDYLHFWREYLKRLAHAVAAHHTDAYCLFKQPATLRALD